jgi:hypothetical protein
MSDIKEDSTSPTPEEPQPGYEPPRAEDVAADEPHVTGALFSN